MGACMQCVCVDRKRVLGNARPEDGERIVDVRATVARARRTLRRPAAASLCHRHSNAGNLCRNEGEEEREGRGGEGGGGGRMWSGRAGKYNTTEAHSVM